MSPILPAAAAEETTPWLYENSDVPVDRSWLFGELDNGLRYAVKRNGAPPGAVSIRVRIDAGALMEEDTELGYAHLLEHLAFSASEHVPSGEVRRVWQALGATFGSDSNALTTDTQTVYQLDLPDIDRAKLDESLKILSGMMRAPVITQDAIDNEVRIVLAEIQDGEGPQRRLIDGTRQHFYAGQRLGERRTSGDRDVLRAATSESVGRFHRRWYRPEKTVISIAGDAPPELLEELLKKHFSGWKGQGTAGTIPDFGDPIVESPKAATFADATYPRSVSMAVLRPWRKVDDTIVYNEGLLINELALAMINRRLEERARSSDSFLQALVSTDDVSRSVDATFVSVVPLDEDWESALLDVRAVIADAMATPPSVQDIAREVAEFDAALKISVEGYDSQMASKQADMIVEAVDIRETIATPQTALDVFRNMQPRVTPQRILQATNELFQGTVTKVMLTTPEAKAGATEQLAAALAKDISAIDARVDQAEVRFEDLPPIGRRGSVVSSQSDNALDIETIELSNGVRVILFPSEGERGKIMVNARFGRGYAGFSPEQGSMLWSGKLALLASGIGTLDQNALDRLTTGRRIELNFGIDDDAFELTANTRPADLRDQLYLMAAKLTDPRWDSGPLKRAKAGMLIGYDSFEASPRTVLERDFQWLVRGRDPRWEFPSQQAIKQVTPEGFQKFWQPVLAKGRVEVMLFGDFERDQAIDALLETFGAMPKRKAWRDPKDAVSLAFPAANSQPELLYHRGDNDSAAAVIAWPTGGGLDEIGTSRQLSLLAQIFSERLFERFRLQEGVSYSPQAFQDWPVNSDQGGYFAAQTLVKAEDVDRFFALATEIARELRETPISEAELENSREPLRQMITRATSGNSFWMWQLEGASYNPAKFGALRSILRDYSDATPASLQALAQRFLRDETGWRLVVLPEAQNREPAPTIGR